MSRYFLAAVDITRDLNPSCSGEGLGVLSTVDWMRCASGLVIGVPLLRGAAGLFLLIVSLHMICRSARPYWGNECTCGFEKMEICP